MTEHNPGDGERPAKDHALTFKIVSALERIADALESLDRWHREEATLVDNAEDGETLPVEPIDFEKLGFTLKKYTIGLNARYKKGVLTGRSLYLIEVKYGNKVIYDGDDRYWREPTLEYAKRHGIIANV